MFNRTRFMSSSASAGEVISGRIDYAGSPVPREPESASASRSLASASRRGSRHIGQKGGAVGGGRAARGAKAAKWPAAAVHGSRHGMPALAVPLHQVAAGSEVAERHAERGGHAANVVDVRRLGFEGPPGPAPPHV